jgi:beta-phosphoglucomutase
MNWVNHFQFFLFDFDGVLVDTEHLHYAAYAQMCQKRGFEWNWSFEQYCMQAHGEAQGIKIALYREFPALFQQESNWEVLASEKKKIYSELIEAQGVRFMPGVEKLLHHLHASQKAHCVVTNSSKQDVDRIKRHLPLHTIPFWITREDYSLPKPSPEGYDKAIAQYATPNDSIIGFEDTFKGFKALSQTRAQAVLICPSFRAHIAQCLKMCGKHFESFETISI